MQYIQKAFTLIELMIVVAIIGILATVAIPAYQDYITRAQMAEVISVLGSLKSPALAYYAENGTFPDKTELLSTGVVKLPTRYVSDIRVARNNIGYWKVYTIVAVISSTGVSDKIKGKVLILSTPDSGKTWYCQRNIFQFLLSGFPDNPWTSDEFFPTNEDKYLPPICRGGLDNSGSRARGPGG